MPKRNELGQFIAIFRGTFGSVKGGLATIGFAAVLGALIGLMKGGSIQNLVSTSTDIFLLAGGVAALLLLFAKYHAVRIYSDGIECKSYWSLPVRLYWHKIGEVRLDSSNGIPAVVLTEQDSRREMWIFKEVFFREDFQLSIQPYLDINADNE